MRAQLFQVDFSSAKNEQKRRRPVIDSQAQDSNGNYIDQIASDSINLSSSNVVSAPENYPAQYHTGLWSIFISCLNGFWIQTQNQFFSFVATDEFRKSKKVSSEPKVHYVMPEPYDNHFSQDYVQHALNTHDQTNEKSPASSFLEYSSVSRDEPKKISMPKRKKIGSTDFEDYNYFYPESKRIISRTTSKPTTAKDNSEKYYKPQSPGAVITKDVQKNGDEMMNTYHYYYPEEPSFVANSHQNSFDFPSSTFAPSTTKSPKMRFSNKKKSPSVHSSTDSYQYQPVLQRPNEYTPTDTSNQDFIPAYPVYESKNYTVHSTASPSTPSPIKMLKPTRKKNFYLPSSTSLHRALQDQ